MQKRPRVAACALAAHSRLSAQLSLAAALALTVGSPNLSEHPGHFAPPKLAAASAMMSSRDLPEFLK